MLDPRCRPICHDTPHVLNGLCEFVTAQRREQIARKDDTLPAMLGQTLLGQEVGALA